MRTNPAKCFALSIGAGFFLAFLSSHSVQAVNDHGWRIKFPHMVLVFDRMGLSGELHDNWHWAAERMVQQYNSTNLDVFLDSNDTINSTKIEVVAIDEPGDSIMGTSDMFALVNNALVDCGSPGANCGQDPQIVAGRVIINVTNQNVKNFGGNNRRALVLHEFGHITGMGHPTCSTSSVMREDGCQTGTRHRNLTGRDITLLNSFYP